MLVPSGNAARVPPTSCRAGRGPSGCQHRGPQPLVARRAAQRVEVVAVADDALGHPPVHARSAEPQRGPGFAERLRLEIHIAKRVVLPGVGRGRIPPERGPRIQMLVQQVATGVERHAERCVLLRQPGDGWARRAVPR